MTPGLETRAAAAELRVIAGRTLFGYGAIWDRPAKIGRVSEVIRRGAFSAHLTSGAETFLLAHHDFSMPLARTGNASLTLREDDRGLAFEATLPATRAADDILELTRSATITGASIGFRIPPGGDVWSSRGDVRQLTRIELVEVSAVALPAYDGTEVHARSLAFIDNRARLRRLRRELL